MKKIIILVALSASINALSQSKDEAAIRTIFDNALRSGQSYEMLEYLSTKIGQRLSGSAGAAAGVEWSRQAMMSFGFDSVWLQPVMVPHWVRGRAEVARIISNREG
ncbi:MAG TPA: peptidase M28 family protein, partial [Cyclobacteriaceae bacterium]|nr:peptidase M28 family protein [Cyclobacteriaceae bacterium]